MAGRIVLFGATGYTGELTAVALAERGAAPVLAARSRDTAQALAARLGGLDVAVADVGRPDSVRALVTRGDVLVSTVGPFVRWGAPAVQAAIAAGAAYLDSTGEPPFIRAVFERYGGGAQAAGCALLTAFGYDWVPGNLAGALALREAGEAAVRVDIGYFALGDLRAGTSGGTAASLAGVIAEPGFAFRDGVLRTVRLAERVRSFRTGSAERPAASVAGSEHFGLARVTPQLREVNVYLGGFGPLTRPLQAATAGGAIITKVPGVREALGAVTRRLVKGSTGGPDAAARAGTGAHVTACAYDAAGTQLSDVHLRGGNPYDFTAQILAWGAERALAGEITGTGALGPVEAFGLDALADGCAQAGLERA